jgi:hypothetical protein
MPAFAGIFYLHEDGGSTTAGAATTTGRAGADIALDLHFIFPSVDERERKVPAHAGTFEFRSGRDATTTGATATTAARERTGANIGFDLHVYSFRLNRTG